MPVCEKCNSEFSNWVNVDSKTRNLQRRKYCLECSPFGVHNTRKLKEKKTPNICKCGKEVWGKNKCSGCKRTAGRLKIKVKAVEQKGGKCSRCGYSTSTRALQFHHIDPSKKEFNITDNTPKTWEQIEVELEKTILLCSNCHAEKHEGLW